MIALTLNVLLATAAVTALCVTLSSLFRAVSMAGQLRRALENCPEIREVEWQIFEMPGFASAEHKKADQIKRPALVGTGRIRPANINPATDRLSARRVADLAFAA